MNEENHPGGGPAASTEHDNAIPLQDGVFDSGERDHGAEAAPVPEEFREHPAGRPDSPEGYMLPEGFDREEGARFQALADDLGLDRQQFGRLMEIQQDSVRRLDEQVQAEIDNQIAEATSELRRKWGSNYVRNGQLAERALTRFAPPDLVEDLKAGGWTREPGFIQFLHTVGERLGEDSLSGPAARGGSGNPWSKANPNLTEQGRIMRENPALARSLAAQAGTSPV